MGHDVDGRAPDKAYWDDLSPYRAQLVASMEEAWTTFAPVVDSGLARLDS